MPNELKITKCTARPTVVIVHFSAPLEVPGEANPNLPTTYRVWRLTPAVSDQAVAPLVAAAEVTVINVVYDSIIRQAAVLEFEPTQQPGQMLLVEVDSKVRSKEGVIAATGRQYAVQVDGKDKPDDAAQKKDEELKKILQPPYAIGMNLISRDDYNNLKNEYFSQSELSLGLILPMVLIVLGLVLTPQIGLTPPGWPTDSTSWYSLQFWLRGLAWTFMCLAMVRISEALFLVGMERYHKFRLEVKLLILGNWQKQQDAKKTSGSGSDGGSGGKPTKPTPPTAGSALNINLSPVVVDIRSQSSPDSSVTGSSHDKFDKPGGGGRAPRLADEPPLKETPKVFETYGERKIRTED
jgi:hypothetical protein